MAEKEDYFEDGPMPNNRMNDGAGDGGDKEMSKSDEPTFLINSEVCPDMKPGDMLQLRIVGVHDNEYEVAYEEKPEKEEEASESMPEPAEQPQGDGGMYD